MKTFRRPLPTALALTLSAGAFLSVPQEAKAVTYTSLATQAGEKVLSTAFKIGLEMVFGEVLGDSSVPVTLSKESYAEIRSIVDDVVGAYFSTEHLILLQNAYDEAGTYSCDPDFLVECDQELDDNEDSAIEAANAMEEEGLAGGPSYALASALEIATYLLHRDVCDQRQHDCFDTYTGLIIGTSGDIVFHMTSLLDEWHDLEDNVGEYCDYYTNITGWWTDIYGESHTSKYGTVVCLEDYEEYVAGLEDLRDSVLGDSFDALLDEFTYYSTGAWTSGLTSTELFCDSYNDAGVMLKNGSKTMARVGSDYVVSLPSGMNDVYTVTCKPDGSAFYLQDYEGDYVRGGSEANGYDITPWSNTNPNTTKWTAWLRPDGTWALRSKKEGRYLTLADFFGQPATEDKELTSSSELTITVVN